MLIGTGDYASRKAGLQTSQLIPEVKMGERLYVNERSSTRAFVTGPAADTKHLSDDVATRNRATSRNTERVPMTYLLSSPNDPVHGCPVKLCGFTVAEMSGTEAQSPICRVEPFLVNSRILLRNHDSHDRVLFDENVE